jgi:hypothetical protein
LPVVLLWSRYEQLRPLGGAKSLKEKAGDSGFCKL